MEEERGPIMRPIIGQSELITFDIPIDLIHQFKQDVRVVIKYPGLIGIPLPDVLLNPEVLRTVRQFEPMLVPRQIIK
jgi:hypothetical protein